MSEDISNPAYWAGRLRDADAAGRPWQAIWHCGEDRWLDVAAQHRTILHQFVLPDTSVLDVGCGYGRLIDLLPEGWHGRYLGLDISPDFVEKARATYPGREFYVCDLTQDYPSDGWDLAVLLGFESMIKKYLGAAAWPPIRGKIRAAADAVLTLDFTRGWKFDAYRDEFEEG